MTKLTECDASLRGADKKRLSNAIDSAVNNLRFHHQDATADELGVAACNYFNTAIARPQPEAKGPVAAGEDDALAAVCEPWSLSTGEPPNYDSPLSGVFGAGMAYTERLLAKLLDVSFYEGGDGSEDFDNDATMTLVNILVAAGLYDKDENRPISAALASTTPPAEAKTPDAGVEDERDDVLFAFHRYVKKPTPFEVTWWTRHFPQFADDIRAHAVEAIDMEARAALTPTGSAGEDDTGVREAIREGERLSLALKASAVRAPDYAPQPPKAETPAGVWPEYRGEGVWGERSTLARAMAEALGERGCGFDIGMGVYEIAVDRVLQARAALSTAPAARPGDEVEADKDRLDWLEQAARKSRSGISFDHIPSVEGERSGFRFMRKFFIGDARDTLRSAIDAARGEVEQIERGEARHALAAAPAADGGRA